MSASANGQLITALKFFKPKEETTLITDQLPKSWIDWQIRGKIPGFVTIQFFGKKAPGPLVIMTENQMKNLAPNKEDEHAPHET